MGAATNTSKTNVVTAFFLVAILIFVELTASLFTPFWERLEPLRMEKKQQYENWLLSGEKYDAVFVGSSTTMMGIDPHIIETQGELRTYNAGQLGYAPLNIMHDVIEEIIEARLTNTIIYQIDSWAFSLPFRDRSVVDQHGRGKHILWQFASFRNRDVFFYWLRSVVNGNLIPPTEAWHAMLEDGERFSSFKGTSLDERGYVETNGLINSAWPGYLRPTVISPAQDKKFEQILEICSRAGVRLVVVRPPEFQRTYDENPEAHEMLSTFLDERVASFGFEFIDYSQRDSFPHAEKHLFFDMHHVNENGAVMYSEQLSSKLY